ncbi:LEAF RUST 10 DISEASE-RESISTANCE LOCUS RECEPTOR-LIKE PROTEIN KINASE-like 2.1 [Actinidia eriantha]|uniref:LEAF RUST 10 DISEASE-RESISTANCE LOCUS RECEPTOR-LIKE PROTEIN KINASE-like 2.1 n=1 Tax=Actinidia eriantha TaxID=165200 RepID=UPI00258463B8|nr:LEAF RUST 10 DISEASE-RESISTANCE LOCUS RECEPTOR-LIKE PROTEIN KINASE-like 2.1 [Actinidia eriantha]
MQSLLFLIIAVLTSINLSSSLCVNEMRYANCSESFNCGNIRTVQYPFWGVNRADYCGLPNFELECKDEVPKITIVSVKYRILEMNPSTRTFTIARDDLWNDTCPVGFPNTTLDFDLFDYHSDIWNVTLFYGCTYFRGPTIGFSGQYNCPDNSVGVDASVYYVMWTSSNVDDLYTGSCNSSVVVSVLESAARGLEANTTTIGAAVDGGFKLFWVPGNDQCITCLESGGVCGHNWTEKQFICFCYDHPSIDSCPSRPPGMNLLGIFFKKILVP